MSPADCNIDTKVYRKSSRGLGQAIDLDADTGRVLVAIDEDTPLSKVAELAQVSVAALWKAIAKLTRLGLIEDVDGHSNYYMGRSFLDKLHMELAKAVGPMSVVLTKNVAVQMDILLPHIPVEHAREMVQKLAGHIPDETAGALFQQSMLTEI